jgi:hypothetical protein
MRGPALYVFCTTCEQNGDARSGRRQCGTTLRGYRTCVSLHHAMRYCQYPRRPSHPLCISSFLRFFGSTPLYRGQACQTSEISEISEVFLGRHALIWTYRFFVSPFLRNYWTKMLLGAIIKGIAPMQPR